jgi:hypothetical protein
MTGFCGTSAGYHALGAGESREFSVWIGEHSQLTLEQVEGVRVRVEFYGSKGHGEAASVWSAPVRVR